MYMIARLLIILTLIKSKYFFAYPPWTVYYKEKLIVINNHSVMSSLVFVFSLLLWTIQSTVKVNELFSDGLILQTNKQDGVRSFIYGTAAPNEAIKIGGNIQGAPYLINADSKGDWKVEINPSTNFGTIMTVNIIGENNNITIKNVKMGDVFLCVGADNMAYPMSDIFNASQEIAKSSKYPKIHFAKIPVINANKPQTQYGKPIQWTQANPNTLPSFSALCYLSAQKLLQMYGNDRNMALIQVAVPQSTLDCWMSSDAIKQATTQCSDIINIVSRNNNNNICNSSTLFNGMIAPLAQQTYRSGIYAQGINDIATNYACKWSIMINNYRDLFGSGDYPFAFIQASSANSGNKIGDIRMEQSNNQPIGNRYNVDTTAMVVSYDLGNKTNTVQSYKVEIGQRTGLKLARIAPVTIYDHNESLYDGPVINYVQNSGNNEIILNFTNLGEYNTEKLQLKATLDCTQCCAAKNTFQVSNDGKTWQNITSFAVNNNNLLVLQLQASVTNAMYVRYAYANFVQCAVFRNGLNIPSAPFMRNINHNKNAQKPLQESLNMFPHMHGTRAAQTPPMGFNHWNFAHCNIDERISFKVAQFMVNSGLAAAGYEYFNLDDCWQTDREYSSQVIIPDSVRFPSGMKALSDKIKSIGMKFGVYTAAHSKTCQGRYGSYMHEAIDVNSYCEWGVSYIKVDQCGGQKYPQANTSWIKFRNAIDECYNKTGNDMVLSVESCGSVTGCGEWIGNIANMWRTGGDIQDNWKSVIGAADHAQGMYSIAGPGHWNDPDMLEIGNPGLSLNEEKVHFSLWAIMASPLLIGTNLLEINNDSLNILLNKEVIAVNQDILGKQGHKLVANTSGTEVWFRSLVNNNVAVCLLNRMSTGSADITVKFSDVGIASTVKSVSVRDIWQHKDIGHVTTGEYTANKVPYHDCIMLKLTPNQ
eukprot:277442_1